MAENSSIEWTDHIDHEATGRTLGAYKSAATKTGCSVEEWMERRAAGAKWCFRCRSWKAAKDFSIDGSRGGGRSSTCKACTSEAATASRYRLTRAELAGMRAAQGNQCPICSREQTLVVDHEHETGAIRGLLCTRCNVGLGQFEDSPQLLRAALGYLERRDG